VNVNNNCSTGSSALYQANNAVKYGQVECALALGFERMKPGSLGTNFPDRPSPTLLINQRSRDLEEVLGENHGPNAPRMFDNGAQEYFSKYGGGVEHLAKIGTDVIRNLLCPNILPLGSLEESQTFFAEPLLTIPRWVER